MGATLRYAKVVDREDFFLSGGVIRPGLDSGVRLPGPAPARAAPFIVMRAWDQFDSAFTETWRLLDAHGRTVREPVSREVTAADGDVADEIDDQEFEYEGEYQLVLEVEGREVARADFPVREP
jgi:hypothetical protein